MNWLKLIIILINHRDRFKDFIDDIKHYKAKIAQTRENMVALYDEIKREYNE